MSIPTVVKVSSRYQMAVPAIVRKKLHIKKGDELIVDVQGDIVVIIPKPVNYSQSLAGLHRQIWEDTDAEKYIAGERDAWEPSPKG